MHSCNHFRDRFPRTTESALFLKHGCKYVISKFSPYKKISKNLLIRYDTSSCASFNNDLK